MADGLIEKDMITSEQYASYKSSDYDLKSDIILSFGGDGTLLNTAHEIRDVTKPLLGVNIGRLGFLANVEIGELRTVII